MKTIIADSKPFLHNGKYWFAVRTKRNQERVIKTKLEVIGVEHFIPFRQEIRQRKDRKVKLQVPVIPNIIFLFTDYLTSLSIINDYGLNISLMKSIGGSGPLIVPEKQMDNFMRFCENKVPYTRIESFVKGKKIIITSGPLAGLEGELVSDCKKKTARIIIKLDGIASFEVVIGAEHLNSHPSCYTSCC